jgi:hypothetical protein
MKRGESVEEFGERLRELAMGLAESIEDYVMQQWLIVVFPLWVCYGSWYLFYS